MIDAMASLPDTTEASGHRQPAPISAPNPSPGTWQRGGPWVLGTLAAAATWISIELTRVEGGIATLWIANGLMVAALLVSPRPRWSALLIAGIAGTMAGRVVHGDELWRV